MTLFLWWSLKGIYLRDEESGAVWSPTTLPVRTLHSSYRIRHGQGYTVFEHNSHGIEQELITFVPLDLNFGKPVRVQSLRLKNISRRRRQISVTTYAEWTLGTDREETQTHIVTSWDAASHTLLARNNYNPEFSRKVAFATLSPHVQSFTGDRTEFLGRNHSSSGSCSSGAETVVLPRRSRLGSLCCTASANSVGTG